MVLWCLLQQGIDGAVANQYKRTSGSINFFVRLIIIIISSFSWLIETKHLPSLVSISFLLYFFLLLFNISTVYISCTFFFRVMSPPAPDELDLFLFLVFSHFLFYSPSSSFSYQFVFSLFLSSDDGRPWLFNRAWWSCRISSEAQPSLVAYTPASPTIRFVSSDSGNTTTTTTTTTTIFLSSLLRLYSNCFSLSAVLMITFDFSRG